MFKCAKIISRYQLCVKSLKGKINSQVQNKVLGRYERLVERTGDKVADYRASLGILQTKFYEKYDVQKKVASSRFRIAALGLFSTGPASDAISISGYNNNDYEILKQLGIVASNDNINTTNASSASINESIASVQNDAIDVINVDSNEQLIPASLYESPYKSIFDNMPPEHARNDIYTSIYNAFNAKNEITTNNDVNPVVGELNDALPVGENVIAVNAVENKAEFFFIDNDVSAKIENAIQIEPIPEPPPIPDAAAELASQFNALGEATFASLGLGGWTPVGMVQQCFEFLHVTLGIPWWEAIAIGTLCIRFCMFPLVVMSQRNAAKMNNHLPQMQIIQLKMTEARQTGNQLDAARYSQELMQFMKEKDLNPFKNMIVPLAQMPIFISFFMGLRQMANVPVDSLRTGGMFWFTDLTVPDQFFALPIITSLTLYATIELGTDSARLSSQNLQTMKYVLRALPFVILPFTVNFPGAILCYWVSSNFISLAQVGFLRIPAVRDYFKIDPLLTHSPANLPIKSKGFVGGLKESWTNIKITKEFEERRRIDDLQFRRAGKGPLVKTYKYDPTKQISNAALKAKSR